MVQLKRVHFHDFMLNVHSRLRDLSARSDPLMQVADDISEETNVRSHSYPLTPSHILLLHPAHPLTSTQAHLHHSELT